MKIEKTSFWFTLSKNVYVSFNSPEQLLLYNTINGNSLIVTDKKCIGLINKVYEPINLGVIDAAEVEIDQEMFDFIDKSIKLGIGLKTEKKDKTPKPINLLPILNLQNDIEKLKNSGEDYLIGDHITVYLNSLSIYINLSCKQNCDHCNGYYKQTLFCTSSKNIQNLSLDIIEDILSQASYTPINRINILGGDIMLYPYWNDLINLLKNQPYDFHLYFNLKNLTNFDNILNIPFHKEILVNGPFDTKALEKLISLTEFRSDFTFNFIVENETNYNTISDIINSHQELNYEFIPFYNGINLEFLKKNVFIDENDILSDLIEMRSIFRNQKLNANFFGHLNILPNGQVKSNMNVEAIGNFPEKSLLELIYEELNRNTMWRKIRDGSKCSKCRFRYLCPPPANLEIVLDKQNLCVVN